MTPRNDILDAHEEAVALAEGFLELQGQKYKTPSVRRLAALVYIDEEFLYAHREPYRAALCDKAREQPDAHLLLLALEEAGFRCRRCRSVAVRLPLKIVRGKGRSPDDYVLLCAACRERFRALTPEAKVKALARMGRPSPRIPLRSAP